MKKIIVTTLLGLNIVFVLAQNSKQPIMNIPFQGGEMLGFSIKYSSSLLDVVVADLAMTIDEVQHEGQEALKIEAYSRTKGFFDVFFEIEDKYTTWVCAKTLKSLKMIGEIKEGETMVGKNYDFDWTKNIATTIVSDHVSNNTLYDTVPLIKNSYDVLGLFYNMRTVSRETIKRQKNFERNVVLDDTIRQVWFRYEKQEVIELEKLGTVKTLKFSGTLVTQSGTAITDGDIFYLWVSDDKNKIPLYLESPIRVGSVVVELSSWGKLKYPLSCLIQ